MIALDLPPKIPLVKPAIIRPAEHKLLRPHYLPATKEQKRAAIRELVESGQLTIEQAKRALIFFCVPMFHVSSEEGFGFSYLSGASGLSSGSASSSFSFTGQSLGAAHAHRYIIVALGYADADGSRTVSSVKIHVPDTSADPTGITATQVVTTNFGSRTYVYIFIAAVPTGTSGSVVIAMSGSTRNMFCGLYRFIQPSGVVTAHSTAVGSSGSSPVTTSTNLVIPSGGFGICVGVESGINSSNANGIVGSRATTMNTTETLTSDGSAISLTQMTANGTAINFGNANGASNRLALATASWGP